MKAPKRQRFFSSPLKRWDKKYLWHPFTQMQEWTEDQILVIDKGQGSWLRDTEGNWYLDGVSSLWTTVHGHREKTLNRAILKQLDCVAHSTLLGLSNVPSILLAKELIRIAPPGIRKVFYSDSGSTAVEIALKMAYQYWKLKGEERPYFLKFKNAYHGDTVGSVSVGGMALFHKIFSPLLFKTFQAPWPHTYWKPKGKSLEIWKQECLKKVELCLQKYGKKIASVIMEPLIQGASGMATAPEGFLKDVETLCRKYGVLLIVDEVATGFGRTGKMFACAWENVRPDLICVAKGISGGYLPLAATLVTEEIFNTFLGKLSEFKTFFHGHTYTGNPLACAAALANLHLFRENKVLKKMKPKIALLQKLLQPLQSLAHVGDVRQRGFMVGIELIQNKEKQIPYPIEEKMGIRVCQSARKRKLLLRPLGNVIVLMPPLSILEKELEFLVNGVRESILEATK
jgi:adenosylmethionine-8-amino-7-oxononanoate aminotransferase